MQAFDFQNCTELSSPDDKCGQRNSGVRFKYLFLISCDKMKSSITHGERDVSVIGRNQAA